MIWWILGSLVVIGVMAYIAVAQSRKTQESMDAIMHPIYPEISVDMGRKEGDYSKPTVINFTPTRTPSRDLPHQTDRRGVRWVNPNPQGRDIVGMDVGFVDPMDMIIIGDAILNSSSDPGYQPDDSPVYVAPEPSYTPEPTHYSAPEPVESSHSWGESSHSSSSWGESSSSSSWSDSSSSSSDCGGGSDGGGGGGD